jgi:hypothetical protein
LKRAEEVSDTDLNTNDELKFEPGPALRKTIRKPHSVKTEKGNNSSEDEGQGLNEMGSLKLPAVPSELKGALCFGSYNLKGMYGCLFSDLNYCN